MLTFCYRYLSVKVLQVLAASVVFLCVPATSI